MKNILLMQMVRRYVALCRIHRWNQTDIFFVLKSRSLLCGILFFSGVGAEMSPEIQKAQKFFKTAGKTGTLLKKVNDNTPEGLARDLVRSVLDGVTSASNIGFHITTLIGERKIVVNGNDIVLDVIAKRYQCLQKDNATLVNDAKSYDTSKGLDLKAGCPGVGCVTRDAAFALFTRDLVYLTKPFFEGFAGKVVLDEKGEATNKIEAGLFLSLNQGIRTILKALTAEKDTKGDDSTDQLATKSRKSWFSLMSQLKMLETLSVAAEKVAVFFVQVQAVFCPAYDVVALIIGGDEILDFIVVPESTKDIITVEDKGLGELTFDANMLEKDFDDFYPAMAGSTTKK